MWFILAFLLGSAAPAAAFDRNTIVFLGSSSVEYWKSLPADFPRHRTLNLGKAGSTFSYLEKHAASWAERYPARLFVIYSGDNDLAWGATPAEVAASLRHVAETIRSRVPDAEVLLLSVKPNRFFLRRLKAGRVRAANALLHDEALRLGFVHYVDVHAPMLDRRGNPRRELFRADGIHLNEEGYRLWAEILRRRLER